MASNHIASLQDWIGRTSEAEDIVTPRLVASFRATLAPHLAAIDDDAAPLGLHWCLAPEIADTAILGHDGHPLNGGFLPPVSLPRRMWAAGNIRFLAPLRVGDRVCRRSTISEIKEKTGRSGTLCFVTIQHAYENEFGLAIEDSQVIVYREANAERLEVPPATLAPVSAAHQWEISVGPILLFRYSALTFNGHRIHYDAPYATQAEHYGGLVVHGPLQATLLLNFAATITRCVPRHFSYRGVRPAIGSQLLRAYATPVQAQSADLGMVAADGSKTMTAAAQW